MLSSLDKKIKKNFYISKNKTFNLKNSEVGERNLFKDLEGDLNIVLGASNGMCELDRLHDKGCKIDGNTVKFNIFFDISEPTDIKHTYERKLSDSHLGDMTKYSTDEFVKKYATSQYNYTPPKISLLANNFFTHS